MTELSEIDNDTMLKELRNLSEWISERSERASESFLRDWDNSAIERENGYSVSSSLYQNQKMIFPEQLKKIVPYTIAIRGTLISPFNSISLVRDGSHLLFLLTNLKVTPVDSSIVMLSSLELDFYNKAFSTVYRHLCDTFHNFEARYTGDLYYKENMDFIIVFGTVQIVAGLKSGTALKAHSAIINYCAPSFYDNSLLDDQLDLSKSIFQCACQNLLHSETNSAPTTQPPSPLTTND